MHNYVVVFFMRFMYLGNPERPCSTLCLFVSTDCGPVMFYDKEHLL